jgi:hypothetical protein
MVDEDFNASIVCNFWKHERMAVGLWRWPLFLVLTLCIVEFDWKCSWLFTIKFINVNMHSHGRGKISNLMNRFLHEFLDLTPAIILTVLFCKLNISRYQRKFKRSKYRMEGCLKVNNMYGIFGALMFACIQYSWWNLGLLNNSLSILRMSSVEWDGKMTVTT